MNINQIVHTTSAVFYFREKGDKNTSISKFLQSFPLLQKLTLTSTAQNPEVVDEKVFSQLLLNSVTLQKITFLLVEFGEQASIPLHTTLKPMYLRSLKIIECANLTDQWLELICTTFKHITTLNISETLVSEVGLSHSLKHLKCLQKLTIGGIDNLRGTFLDSIQNTGQIQKLIITNYGHSFNPYYFMSVTFPALTHLEIPLGNDLRDLAQRISRLGALQILRIDLSNFFKLSLNISVFANALKNHSSLQKIILFEQKYAQKFANLIKKTCINKNVIFN